MKPFMNIIMLNCGSLLSFMLAVQSY